MDTYLGRLTFGFLLSQVAPGFILVSAFWAISSVDFGTMSTLSVAMTITEASAPWMELLFVGTILGVIIHQVSWATGGWMIKQEEEKKFKIHKLKKVRSIVIIVLGPILTIVPMVLALTISRRSDLVVDEFLPDIAPDRFDQWQWLQNFYLYSAEFCGNLGIAFAILVAPLWICGAPYFLVAVAWLGSGVLFILKRRAFDSLFAAEAHLSSEE